MKRRLLVALIIPLLLVLVGLNVAKEYTSQSSRCCVAPVQVPEQAKIKLPSGYKIFAAIADTESERQRGLSGRGSLNPDAGMWFVFDQLGIYQFWMPEMNFPIDIIWVDAEMRVVQVAANVQPEPGVDTSQLKRYANQSPARYVLEVPAGTADRHQVVVGSRLQLLSS